MLTPAQKHWQRMAAKGANSVAAKASQAALTEWERMKHRLNVDKRQLKDVQSNELKAGLKRKLLPKYQGWIEGVLASGTGQPDEVFVTCMIWSIDAGLTAQALDMAEYVIAHGLAMPDKYQRTSGTVIVEEICEPVLTAFNIDARHITVSGDDLRRLDTLTEKEDMPDVVRAKLYKCLGFTLRQGALDDKIDALVKLERAMVLYKKAGVKNDIRDLKKAIERETQQQADAAASE